MEKSGTIVASRTHGMGNLPCASSDDNVPAVVRLGRPGGLASDQAATLRNHCSVVIRTHMKTVCGRVECAEPVGFGRRQYSRASSDKGARETLRRKGGGMAIRSVVQSREGPCSISVATGTRNANSGHIWGQGLAHEVVVAMITVITSGKSEGPLGVRGYGEHGDRVYCSYHGLLVPERKLGVKGLIPVMRTDLRKVERADHNEAYRKPKGKAIGEMRNLKPDCRKCTVRDFRGGEGNGGAEHYAMHPLRPLSTRLSEGSPDVDVCQYPTSTQYCVSLSLFFSMNGSSRTRPFSTI